jgi:adhesin/invasin
MSQGLTWIADRRLPLVALVAIFALAAGMFAAFGPAHAADGDVTAAGGFCVSDGEDDPTFLVRETNATGGELVTVESGLEDDGTTSGVNMDEANPGVPCDSDQAGLPVTVTPDGSVTPIIEVKAAAVSITLSDSDGVVQGGQDITATVTVKNFQDNEPTIQWVRVSGVLDGPGTVMPLNDGDTACSTAFATCSSTGNVIEIPDGTSEGEYTVSARINYDDMDATNGTDDVRTVATKTFTIGDSGTNVASAALELGTADYDDTKTVKDEAKAEDGSEPASGDIWLKVSVSNSLGNPSNPGGVNGITVFATGGATLQVVPANAAGRPNTITPGATGGPAEGDTVTGNNSATLNEDGDDDAADDDVGSTMFVKVTKTNKKPGTVNVWAIVTGSDGSGTTETLDLVFTGGASELTLGDAANVAPLGLTEFSVAATDGGGNATAPGRVRYSVTDADGKAVGSSSVSVATGAKGDSTPDYALDNNANAVAGIVTIGETAASGQYTITGSIVGVSDSETTTTVTVVGNPADVAVEASSTTSDTIGDIITVTATVTDEDGNAVSGATLVTFSVSDNTGLSKIGADHVDRPTRDGVATAKYAVVGAGTSVVSASAGGATGVAVIVSTAGVGPAASADPVDGLSQTELNNFASWSGDGTVSGSELLAGIAGATGLLFYDGDSWQRYGADNGQVIPGSRDFTIRSGQTIWISG